MTRREVLVSKIASRELGQLPDQIAERIRPKLGLLREHPFRKRSGADIRLVWGHDDPPLTRLRIRDDRVFFFVVGEEVRVTEILHRARAYRGLD